MRHGHVHPRPGRCSRPRPCSRPRGSRGSSSSSRQTPLLPPPPMRALVLSSLRAGLRKRRWFQHLCTATGSGYYPSVGLGSGYFPSVGLSSFTTDKIRSRAARPDQSHKRKRVPPPFPLYLPPPRARTHRHSRSRAHTHIHTQVHMYLLLTLQLAFQIIVAQVCVCLLVCLPVCCMCLGPSAVCAGTEERLPVVGVVKSWSERVRRRGAGGWVGE